MNTNWQTSQPPERCAAFPAVEPSSLKLSLETRHRAGVVIVHCHGRIVYREEAAMLCRVASSLIEADSNIIVDLTGVTSIDSAGLGEFAWLHTTANDQNANLKFSGANMLVRALLELTNLDSVLDLYPTLQAALETCPSRDSVCADC